MIRRALLAGWLAACGAVLAFTLLAYAPGPRSDAGLVFAGAMAALTFPGGLLVPGAVAVLSALNGGDLPAVLADVPPWAGFTVLWLAFCVVGGVQWFWLVPWLWHRWRHPSADRVDP